MSATEQVFGVRNLALQGGVVHSMQQIKDVKSFQEAIVTLSLCLLNFQEENLNEYNLIQESLYIINICNGIQELSPDDKTLEIIANNLKKVSIHYIESPQIKSLYIEDDKIFQMRYNLRIMLNYLVNIKTDEIKTNEKEGFNPAIFMILSASSLKFNSEFLDEQELVQQSLNLVNISSSIEELNVKDSQLVTIFKNLKKVSLIYVDKPTTNTDKNPNNTLYQMRYNLQIALAYVLKNYSNEL